MSTSEIAAYEACVTEGKRYQPKCDLCGKFRKHQDLRENVGGVKSDGWDYYVACRWCEPLAFLPLPTETTKER